MFQSLIQVKVAKDFGTFLVKLPTFQSLIQVKVAEHFVLNQIIHQTSCAVKSKGFKFPPNYFANHHNNNYFLYDFSEYYLRNMAITEKVYSWNDWVRIISLSAKGKGWILVIDSKFHQIGFGLAAHSSRIFKIFTGQLYQNLL